MNCTLKGATLCPVTRKPFDVLVEGLDLSISRGDSTPIELFLEGVREWKLEIRGMLGAKTVCRPEGTSDEGSLLKVMSRKCDVALSKGLARPPLTVQQPRSIQVTTPVTVGAFAIVPSNDLPAAVPFWERLGFLRVGGDVQYVIMSGWGCEVHLTQAGKGPWRVPAENNPFGVFIRTPQVEEIAARVDDLVIRPGGILRHREWGLFEVGIAGPDGLLVRIGWPSELINRD